MCLHLSTFARVCVRLSAFSSLRFRLAFVNVCLHLFALAHICLRPLLLRPPFQGFSNVPWHKRAFGPGTKFVFLEVFLGILRGLV